jgi:hypothetical protein
MNKTILILNLIVKGIVEFVIVMLLAGTIGVLVFIVAYLGYSIQNAIEHYKSASES